MKKKYSTILVACAVFALIVAAIVLIAGRTTTLEFSDLMPKSQSRRAARSFAPRQKV